MLETYRAVIGVDQDDFDSARDADGHGTHTASTAAGNADVEAVAFGEEWPRSPGIAPDAHVIAYKGLGLRAASPPTWPRPSTRRCSTASTSSTTRSAAAPTSPAPTRSHSCSPRTPGSSLPRPPATRGRARRRSVHPAVTPWITAVGANTQKRFFQGRVTVGSQGSKGWRWHKSFGGASLTLGTDGKFPLVDAEFAGGEFCIPGELDPAVVTGTIVLCRRGVVGRADKSFAVAEAGGVGMVLYNESRRRQPVHRPALGAVGAHRPDTGSQVQGLHRGHRQPGGKDPHR